MTKKRVDGERVYKATKKGRKGKWNDEQRRLIDGSIAIWHNFACIVHKDADGNDQKLSVWKKEESDRLLRLPEFRSAGKLPEGVSDSFCTEMPSTHIT